MTIFRTPISYTLWGGGLTCLENPLVFPLYFLYNCRRSRQFQSQAVVADALTYQFLLNLYFVHQFHTRSGGGRGGGGLPASFYIEFTMEFR